MIIGSSRARTVDAARTSETPGAPIELAGGSTTPRSLRRFLRHGRARVGCALVLAMVALSLLVPIVAPEAATRQDLLLGARGPSLNHIFGTDELGRDMLARIAEGGRVSLMVGLLSMGLALLIGGAIGIVAGSAGGWVDAVLMRVTDMALGFPSLLLLIVIAQLLGTSLLAIIIAIAFLRWMTTARVVRSSYLSEREMEYVLAARAVGVQAWRIALRHVLPNAAGPLVVSVTLGVAGSIITESTLSYLGLGVQPPTATWGNLLRGAQDQLFRAPWLAIFPGASILVAVLGINSIGDALRDVMTPEEDDES